ncbi:hypothetical protein GOP47_0025330 [Adiantum capillus-veneris]|uniref:Uncharacterized protein n=1 Tax=Adiantum capillus-veneris TaxID=13818 RepID=A0A9D4U2L5_ADICA|nr:hypothetical protein GOP47_0025330 [Adiantum capillus-veneris]
MASSSAKVELPDLKYLGFIEILAEKATKRVANVYTFAKDNTGPLKASVDGIETTIKIIIEPICNKLEGKPHELLLFVEKKVDGVVDNVDCAFFHHVKEKSFHAYDIVQQLQEIAKLLVGELQHGDILESAKTYYHTYEPVAQEWSYAAWKQFLKLPFAAHALRFATPASIFCAKKTNDVLDQLKEMHIPFASAIPNIPVDKLEEFAKAHVA